MRIDLQNGVSIGDGCPCFIVAEIGQNHNGDCYTAIRLMKACADAGVDAVKLCKRHIPSELTREAYNAPYDNPNSFGQTYGEHREALELSVSEYKHLRDRVRYNHWPFVLFSTVCDMQSVDDVSDSLNPQLYKIASRDLDNLPLLRYVARRGRPVILSTGMARSDDEIQAALDVVRDAGCPVVLLVCTSEYPTEPTHVGLNRIATYRDKFGCLVGMSDHTPGIVAAQAAATLGACVIEKHVTLSRAMRGTDHAASLEPEGLTRLVRNVRLVEQMREWFPTPTDRESIEAVRRKLGRSLVSAREIKAGSTIDWVDVTLKSPGTGISWASGSAIVGKVARRTIPADVTIDASDVLQEAGYAMR
jgi:sialic acid synthase SpsE